MVELRNVTKRCGGFTARFIGEAGAFTRLRLDDGAVVRGDA